jgi:hypothetical protein
MARYQQKSHIPNNELRLQLENAIEHFDHILPAQASIREFVHHNTLHGYESLKFQDALKASNELTGAYAYWSQEKFRKQYLTGRITNADIEDSLANDQSLESDKTIFQLKQTDSYENRAICFKDIYRIALLFPLKRISSCQLKWQSEEAHALLHFQKDIPESAKKRLLNSAKVSGLDTEDAAISDLWQACIESLGLDPILLHPEDLLDLTPDRAEKMYVGLNSKFSINKDGIANDSALSPSTIDPLMRQQSTLQIDQLIEQVGDKLTLRSFLQKLTGIDVQKEIVSHILPYISSWLDEGFVAWRTDSVNNKNFYQAWKESALVDQTSLFNDIDDWKEHIRSLPDDSTETVMAELARMGIPEDKWGAYITRLALDLPGWSGMFYWRQQHQAYKTAESTQVEMMDYLAVRLVLEHLQVRNLCRKLWLFEGDLATIRGYFYKQLAEAFVRFTLYNKHLPEYLLSLSQQLVERESFDTHKDEDWLQLAQMIWTWLQCPASDSTLNSDVRLATYDMTNDSNRVSLLHHDGWKLFRLAQHLGLSGADLRNLTSSQIDSIFSCIHRMDKETAGFVLLQAYERNYREQLFTTITQNHGRGTWSNRDKKRPEAQLIFCMDDREEGFRRHLEHINPAIETLGAAAFFGVVMNWKGIVDKESIILCPVVSTPVHEIQEVADKAHEHQVETYIRRYSIRTWIRNFVHQDMRRSLFRATLLMPLYAPFALSVLIGKVLIPSSWNKFITSLKKYFYDDDTKKITRIKTHLTDENAIDPPTAKNRQLGYTTLEQADIVEGFLQNNGLLSGFAPLVVMMGHYSRNQNNPHASAYGCGACSGKYSGPNGRVFAVMANDSKVRKILTGRGISIPDDCWFIGAEHDTCNENIQWMDTDLIPTTLTPHFERLKSETDQAALHSAHERCRKLASAPKKSTLLKALKHIAGRAVDFSQARPELGHATIASGFIGRRYITQGTFLDRRSFLISYDPNGDPDGNFLERILLSAGPVGAGINLEYYFSSVNNERYGSGSKVTHNLAGLFGVIEGSSGDLRTGLPQQMTEIHEPMRLQLLVEAKTEVLNAIYSRQPAIQQLVGNSWVLLSAKDPESEKIHTFDPIKGWVLWQAPELTTPTVKDSQEWYAGQNGHLSSVLIERANHV